MSSPRGESSQPIQIQKNLKQNNSQSAPISISKLNKWGNAKNTQSAPPIQSKLELRMQGLSFFVGNYEQSLLDQRSKASQEHLLAKEEVNQITTLSEDDNADEGKVASSSFSNSF